MIMIQSWRSRCCFWPDWTSFFLLFVQCARLMTQFSRLAWLMVKKMRSLFCQSFPFNSNFCISDGWWRIRCISCWLTEGILRTTEGKWKGFLFIRRDGEWSEEMKKIQVWIQRQIHKTHKIFTHSFNLTGYLTALSSCRHVQSTWLSEGLRGPFRANIIQISWNKALWGNANVQPWKESEEELGRKRKASLQLSAHWNYLFFLPIHDAALWSSGAVHDSVDR